MDEADTITESVHPLHSQILQEISNRDTWEERQTTWYQMRHDGLRRRSKPFPGAADLHLPLADTMIGKWKPFYGQQIYATETVASFIAMKPELRDFTSSLEQWFDYQIKMRSNFGRQMTVGIDRMLQAGFGVVKITWDIGGKKLRFSALEPAKLIVPWHTEELAEADWLVHVIDISVAKYKTTPGYEQGEDFIKSISGGGSESTTAENAKQLREGITHTDRADVIVLWEVWQRTANGYDVTTYSPLVPGRPVQATHGHPYKHGRAPFVRLDHEVKGNGHYESRGITEQVAPFETYACKQWNEKSDFMSFVNRPLFNSAAGIANPGNLRIKPGSVLPEGVTIAQMPPAPSSFDTEMNVARGMAEYRAGMPDFGVGRSSGTSEPRTAREVGALMAFSQAGITDRGISFREPVREIYEQSWLLLLEYAGDQLDFLAGDEWKQLEAAAFVDGYMVRPNGNADSWDRGARLQKALARQAQFANSPYIDQAELTKSVLELDDPLLAPRLFKDPNAKIQSEYEDEAKLLPTVLLGLPLSVRPEADPAPRIKCLVDFIQSRHAMQEPATPAMQHGIVTRLQGLLAALAARDPAAAKQAQAAIAQTMQTMQEPAQATQGNTGTQDGAEAMG